jgi:hypothetical protein
MLPGETRFFDLASLGENPIAGVVCKFSHLEGKQLMPAGP